MTKLFALTTRGLEPTTAEEIGALLGVTVEQVAYRRVLFNAQMDLEALLKLKTVDDVFLLATTLTDIGRPRTTLETLKTASAKLQLTELVKAFKSFRRLPRDPVFAVTANFVGKRNYNTDEIREACAAGIMRGEGWAYAEKDEDADLNVRVFIEGEAALIGVRLGALSVSKRPYKQQNIPGSLKPTVAAALAMLVEVKPGMRVLDPCCGAGTTLIEAQDYGVWAWGGDTAWAALTASRQNAAEALAAVTLHQWDARALPLASDSIDRVISNLPWGREVNTVGDLASLYREIGEEIKRVLAPEGRAALLVNQPELLIIEGLHCEKQIEISLYGQNPTIMIWKKP
jgi:tRNA (guanine6-N2)-methyltransferase